MFGGLVLGCMKTKFGKKIYVWQHFSSSTSFASFCTAAISNFSPLKTNGLAWHAKNEWRLFLGVKSMYSYEPFSWLKSQYQSAVSASGLAMGMWIWKQFWRMQRLKVAKVWLRSQQVDAISTRSNWLWANCTIWFTSSSWYGYSNLYAKWNVLHYWIVSWISVSCARQHSKHDSFESDPVLVTASLANYPHISLVFQLWSIVLSCECWYLT